MALTPSNMMPLGTTAPDFSLLDTLSGETLSLQSLKGSKGTLVAFICNHCPYVIHIQERFVEVAKTYQEKGIQFIAISSNSVETHPQDGPEEMTQHGKQQGFCFPYLYDESQEVAKSYEAACTPDLFLFDENLSCVYRGQFDDTRPNQSQIADGQSLIDAMEALLNQQPPLSEQQASIGCNIKWKN